jgi:hypothetical protein
MGHWLANCFRLHRVINVAREPVTQQSGEMLQQRHRSWSMVVNKEDALHGMAAACSDALFSSVPLVQVVERISACAAFRCSTTSSVRANLLGTLHRLLAADRTAVSHTLRQRSDAD